MSSSSYSLTIRMVLPARVGTFGRVMAAIGEAGAEVGGVDLVRSSEESVTRDITVYVADDETAAAVQAALASLPETAIERIEDQVFRAHRGGMITMRNRVAVTTRDDLAMAYTPGVARVCMAIHEDIDRAWDYTIKANSVMVVSDGSAVVGQGDLGADAALPAVEAKCLFLRERAGIDAFPLPLRERDPTRLADIIERSCSVFAGIHLTDIAAPRCFDLLAELRERHLGIPVFHDDQEGTAAALLAALSNGLVVVGKSLARARVVVVGLGPGGMATTRILVAAGVGELIACDRRGAVHAGRADLDERLAWVAEHTNSEGWTGDVHELVAGADAVIGLAAPNILSAVDLGRMARDPIVLALAMPTPEISPAEAAGVARVYATGRPDVPNQINSTLAFPGIWRGALDCRARRIDQPMVLAAARAIAASCGPAMGEDYVVPSVLADDLVERVAAAVRATAEATGAARFGGAGVPHR